MPMIYDRKLWFALSGIIVLLSVRIAWAHKWADIKGKYSVEAEFVALESGVVTLKKQDGTTIHVPLEKFSKEDREYAQRQAASVTAEQPPAPEPLTSANGTTLNATSAADINRSFKLPVLAVSAADKSGSCQMLEFVLSRKDNNKAPLSISFTEDTPGGVGESIRASIWLAAMVAALDRLDDLSGVVISLKFSGQLDGPSAGGVICLAILSALDDRDFPQDCAMTGTIMPDGTIGEVGGIVQKMEAAARAGAHRVLVPAYLRFETDDRSGQVVDLKRQAESLHLEFLPVENIWEAYQMVHQLPPHSEKPTDRNALDLPEAIEEVQKQDYGENAQAVSKLWDGIPDAEKEQIKADPSVSAWLIDMRSQAEVAYRAGRFLTACNNILVCRFFFEARQKLLTAAQDIDRQEDFKLRMDKWDEKVTEVIKAVPMPTALIVTSQKTMQESAVQMCGGYCDAYGPLGLMLPLQWRKDEIIDEWSKPDKTVEEKRQLAVDAETLADRQLLFANMTLEAANNSVDEAKKIADTLPNQKISGDIVGVERLFYSSFLAADNTLEKDILPTIAKSHQVTDSQTLATMMTYDPNVACYWKIPTVTQQLHEQFSLAKDRQDSRFIGAAAAILEAGNLAQVSGLITKWGDLQADVNEQGELQYGRTDTLGHLLAAARQNALANITECRTHNILCIQPIYYFESADMSRDDTSADKVNVLVNYWAASLQAKALLMLFAPAVRQTSRADATLANSSASSTPVPLLPGVKTIPRQSTSQPAALDEPQPPAQQTVIPIDEGWLKFGGKPPSQLTNSSVTDPELAHMKWAGGKAPLVAVSGREVARESEDLWALVMLMALAAVVARLVYKHKKIVNVQRSTMPPTTNACIVGSDCFVVNGQRSAIQPTDPLPTPRPSSNRLYIMLVWLLAVLGFFLQFGGLLGLICVSPRFDVQEWLMSGLCAVLGGTLFVFALACHAMTKRRSPAWGLFGIFWAFGMVVPLILLEDRTPNAIAKQEAKM